MNNRLIDLLKQNHDKRNRNKQQNNNMFKYHKATNHISCESRCCQILIYYFKNRNI